MSTLTEEAFLPVVPEIEEEVDIEALFKERYPDYAVTPVWDAMLHGSTANNAAAALARHADGLAQSDSSEIDDIMGMFNA